MALGGTLSIDNQLKAGLKELGCSAAIFCAIASFSTSRLSQAFSEIKALGGNEQIALKKVLDEMKALQADVSAHVGYPIPIAWTPSIRDVLEARRKGLQLWSLELASGFFVRCQKLTGQIVCDRREAAALSLVDATKTQERLQQMGHSPRLVPARASMQTEFEDIWPEQQ